MSDELRDELAKLIARAAYNDQGLSIRDDLRVADAILPIIARERAEAWDEGYQAFGDYLEGPEWGVTPVNPYRAASIETGTG